MRKGDGSGGLAYEYNGWQVGSAALSYNSLSFDVPTPSTVPVNYTEIIEETEPGIKGRVQVAFRKTKAFGKQAGKVLGSLAEMPEQHQRILPDPAGEVYLVKREDRMADRLDQ